MLCKPLDLLANIRSGKAAKGTIPASSITPVSQIPNMKISHGLVSNGSYSCRKGFLWAQRLRSTIPMTTGTIWTRSACVVRAVAGSRERRPSQAWAQLERLKPALGRVIDGAFANTLTARLAYIPCGLLLMVANPYQDKDANFRIGLILPSYSKSRPQTRC